MIYVCFFLTFFVSIFFYLKSFRLGYFYFIAVYFVYPRAFALGLGSSGFALTMQRAQLVLVAIFLIFRLLVSRKDRRYFLGAVGNHFFLFLLPILLWVSEVISSWVTTAPGQLTDTASGLIDDFMYTVVFVMGSTLVLRTMKDITIFIKILCIGIVINFFVVLLEMKLGHTVFQGIKVLFNAAANHDITISVYKDDLQRAQGLMDSDLVMAYAGFMIFILAFAYISAKKFFKIKVKIAWFAILGCLICIFFSRSRAALGLYFGGIVVFIIYSNIKNVTRFFSRQFGLLMLSAVTLLIVLAFVFVPLFNYINELARGQSSVVTEDRSAQERLEQVFALIKANGIHFLFGWGRLRYLPGSFTDNAVQEIDNYFIRQFLQSGIVGLVILLIYFYQLIKFSIKNFKLSFYFRSPGIRTFYFCLVFYSIALFVIFNLSSEITLNLFPYTLLPMLITLKNSALFERKRKLEELAERQDADEGDLQLQEVVI